MSNSSSEENFSKRFNKHGLLSTTKSKVAAAVVGAAFLIPTGGMSYAVSEGAFFPEAKATETAPQGHVVRTHGWGGFYIGIGGGRRHFGGGGSIH